MNNNLPVEEHKGVIIIYQSESGETKIDVRFEDETVWLTQAQLCELYQSCKANVSEHIKNIFEEGELEENSVVRKIRTTAWKQNLQIPCPLLKTIVTEKCRRCPLLKK